MVGVRSTPSETSAIDPEDMSDFFVDRGPY